jgi:hypothetical protein
METTAGKWVETKLKREALPNVSFNIYHSIVLTDSMEMGQS